MMYIRFYNTVGKEMQHQFGPFRSINITNSKVIGKRPSGEREDIGAFDYDGVWTKSGEFFTEFEIFHKAEHIQAVR